MGRAGNLLVASAPAPLLILFRREEPVDGESDVPYTIHTQPEGWRESQ